MSENTQKKIPYIQITLKHILISISLFVIIFFIRHLNAVNYFLSPNAEELKPASNTVWEIIINALITFGLIIIFYTLSFAIKALPFIFNQKILPWLVKKPKNDKEDTYIFRFKNYVRNNLAIIYLLISVIFIFSPTSKFSPLDTYWSDLFQKIGFIILTSGVFASLLKSIQFTGLFKEELHKVINGSELLNNRKDLPELWKKISKIIYSEKFPEISELLEDRILNTYFPTNQNHYNEDIVISIVIESISDDLVIEYSQITEYTAVLDSASNGSFFNFSSSITDEKNTDEVNILESLKIDGEEKKGECKPEISNQNGKSKLNFTFPLQGKKTFKIHQKLKKKYSLKGENYKLIRFNTFVRNVDISVSFPDNIEVSFFSIGVISEFESIHTEMKNTLSKRHRGDLILPKQGFGLTFNKK